MTTLTNSIGAADVTVINIAVETLSIFVGEIAIANSADTVSNAGHAVGYIASNAASSS